MQGFQLLYLNTIWRNLQMLLLLAFRKLFMPDTLPFPTTSTQTTDTHAALLGDNVWSVASSGAGGREGAEHPALNFLPPCPTLTLHNHNGGSRI